MQRPNRFGAIRPENLFPHVCWVSNLLFLQFQNGISYDSPLFHKTQLCGVFTLWLCEQLHKSELWISPTKLLFTPWLLLYWPPVRWKALSRQKFIIFFPFLLLLDSMLLCWMFKVCIFFRITLWLIFIQNFFVYVYPITISGSFHIKIAHIRMPFKCDFWW